jgi:hypothetical protein
MEHTLAVKGAQKCQVAADPPGVRPISASSGARTRGTRHPRTDMRSLARPGKVRRPARTTLPPPIQLAAGAHVKLKHDVHVVGHQQRLDAPAQAAQRQRGEAPGQLAADGKVTAPRPILSVSRFRFAAEDRR